jgi:hypothetical protein
MLGGAALELEIAILQYRRVCTGRAKVHMSNQYGAAPADTDAKYHLCLSEIKLAHTDDEVRQGMA